MNNKRRDSARRRQLNRMGWSYLVLWECQLRKKDSLALLPRKIDQFIFSKLKRSTDLERTR